MGHFVFTKIVFSPKNLKKGLTHYYEHKWYDADSLLKLQLNVSIDKTSPAPSDFPLLQNCRHFMQSQNFFFNSFPLIIWVIWTYSKKNVIRTFKKFKICTGQYFYLYVVITCPTITVNVNQWLKEKGYLKIHFIAEKIVNCTFKPKTTSF